MTAKEKALYDYFMTYFPHQRPDVIAQVKANIEKHEREHPGDDIVTIASIRKVIAIVEKETA